jgi:hypothetical protein
MQNTWAGRTQAGRTHEHTGHPEVGTKSIKIIKKKLSTNSSLETRKAARDIVAACIGRHQAVFSNKCLQSGAIRFIFKIRNVIGKIEPPESSLNHALSM